MKTFLLLVCSFLTVLAMSQTIPSGVQEEVQKGNFTRAQEMMRALASGPTVSAARRDSLLFEVERLERIRQDFPLGRDQTIAAVRKYLPGITAEQIAQYESDGSLEMMVIDGEKKYFHSAASNLLRINAKARAGAVTRPQQSAYVPFVQKQIPEVLAEMQQTGKHLARPVRLTLHYTLTVKPNAVPAGEVIRCWLPYPREGHSRQSDIRLLSVNAPEYVIAGNEHPQRTLYLEKRAEPDQATVFDMRLAYTCSSERYDLTRINGGEGSSEAPGPEFTSERPPHIVFTDELRALSKSIVGEERDPVRKAQRIFAWISQNIPWASAREYSTIQSIPHYCVENKHGDCGIQTMLFMTLARLNGIPTRWQSGWMLHPVEVNLHDWCEMYVRGVGWVPVDQSFGLQALGTPEGKYFYFGGIDSYRLIVNDDFSSPLFPAKVHPRSETVDFQRGEVEWRGGNLYFDTWRYHMDVKYDEEQQAVRP